MLPSGIVRKEEENKMKNGIFDFDLKELETAILKKKIVVTLSEKEQRFIVQLQKKEGEIMKCESNSLLEALLDANDLFSGELHEKPNVSSKETFMEKWIQQANEKIIVRENDGNVEGILYCLDRQHYVYRVLSYHRVVSVLASIERFLGRQNLEDLKKRVEEFK